MAKVLRFFVILLFLMAAGAVALEYMLFRQWPERKARTQTLEKAVLDIAQTLTSPKEPYIEGIDQKINVNSLMNSATMGTQLRVLETLADNRYEQLFTTKDELKKTRDDLSKTRQELAQTKQDLDTARKDIVALSERLAQKTAELAEAQQKIGRIEGEIAELGKTMEAQKAQVAKLETEKTELNDENQRLEIELARYLNDPTIVKQMPRGLSGKIVVVNPDWNFVVLDIGTQEGLVKNAYMLVHRSDQLIGKVKIMDAREHMAIADIQREWASAPLQEGDRVLY
ncbi:MAG: hypothetical protein BWK77_07475 [Verrucomicrobia bacterium A1]|nr:MAG: hypothetical protein BWK77_07475 [Verrucomicrobia bacterium A1]